MAQSRRRIYGITEVAESLGLNRQLVTVWRRRGSWDMPAPDEELSSGPIWLNTTIEPWLEATRLRLAAPSPADVPLTPALAARAARRVLRLVALLLEEEVRSGLARRAWHDAVDLLPAVRATTTDATFRDRLLDTLHALGTEEPSSEGSPSWDTVRSRCLSALPALLAELPAAVADSGGSTQPRGRRSAAPR